MATIDLGKIRFNWQGAYNNSTAYVINDVVSSGGNSYICKLASTGNAVSNGTYWDLMSSAGTNGTNGTDVGTVITTQGDVLYRDGSGLQRLAKGTAGQVLKINSGATAPEWSVDQGGAWTKITSSQLTSPAASVELTGIDTVNDYRTYIIVLAGVVAESNSQTLWCQMGKGSSNYSTSGTNNYYHHNRAWYGSGSGGNYYGHAGTTLGIALSNGSNLSTEGTYNAVLYLHDDPIGFSGTGSRYRPYIHGRWSGNDHSANHGVHGVLGGEWRDAAARITSVRFLLGSGNLKYGLFTLYGLKTS